MGLSRQVEDGVDLVSSQTFDNICPTRYVAMEEGKVRSSFQHARVVPRAAVIQLVERNDCIVIRVLGYQVSNKPGRTNSLSLATIILAMVLT